MSAAGGALHRREPTDDILPADGIHRTDVTSSPCPPRARSTAGTDFCRLSSDSGRSGTNRVRTEHHPDRADHLPLERRGNVRPADPVLRQVESALPGVHPRGRWRTRTDRMDAHRYDCTFAATVRFSPCALCPGRSFAESFPILAEERAGYGWGRSPRIEPYGDAVSFKTKRGRNTRERPNPRKKLFPQGTDCQQVCNRNSSDPPSGRTVFSLMKGL